MDTCYGILGLQMDESQRSAFGDWLLSQMRDRNWSMSALANRAGVSKQVVSKYINQPPREFEGIRIHWCVGSNNS